MYTYLVLASGDRSAPSQSSHHYANKTAPQKLKCTMKLYIHTHQHTNVHTKNPQELMILRVRRFPITSDTKTRVKSTQYLRTYPLTSLATEILQNAYLNLRTHTTILQAPKSSQNPPPQGNFKLSQRRLYRYS
jgi:hypothetical protein